MRIYQPLQRKHDGRWDMTVSSDEEHWCHSIGYCSGTFEEVWPPWSEKHKGITLAYVTLEHYENARSEAFPHRNKYHKDGHASAAEAETCYDEYCLDTEWEQFDDPNVQKRCQICNMWTIHRVRISSLRDFILCPAHAFRDQVRKLLK